MRIILKQNGKHSQYTNYIKKPTVKKVWDRENEGRLLHLAKIMPNQWRSIAPIVGATASQCEAHYNRLLNEAEKLSEGKDPEEPIEEKFHRVARGGLLDHITEEEQQMLDEARARLYNTKRRGNRKLNMERKLAEARRLEALQQRRAKRLALTRAPQEPSLQETLVRKSQLIPLPEPQISDAEFEALRKFAPESVAPQYQQMDSSLIAAQQLVRDELLSSALAPDHESLCMAKALIAKELRAKYGW